MGPGKRTIEAIREQAVAYRKWFGSVVGKAASFWLADFRKHWKIEVGLSVAAALARWATEGWCVSELKSALVTGGLTLGFFLLLTMIWQVAMAPFRVHQHETQRYKRKWLETAEKRARDRATLRKLTAEDLAVTLRLQQYADGVHINVANNQDTDVFFCEVIGWGPERPNQRTHFPWKVRWRETPEAGLEITSGTSGSLYLARFRVYPSAEGRPSWDLTFMLPQNKESLHRASVYHSKEQCKTEDLFVRLLVSAKSASQATQKVLQLRILADMRDDFNDPRDVYREPEIRARWV